MFAPRKTSTPVAATWISVMFPVVVFWKLKLPRSETKPLMESVTSAPEKAFTLASAALN